MPGTAIAIFAKATEADGNGCVSTAVRVTYPCPVLPASSSPTTILNALSTARVSNDEGLRTLQRWRRSERHRRPPHGGGVVSCALCASDEHDELDCPLGRRALLESWELNLVKVIPHKPWRQEHK